MPKYLDFPTIYGKLGNHPGLLTGEQALALFTQGMKCPQGASLVEYWPDGGRSTVILAAVARNLGGRLYVFTNWRAAPQSAERWFMQAWRTHKLDQVCALSMDVGQIEAVANPALIVVRGDYRPPYAGRLLVLGDIGQANGHAPAERGPGWYVLPGYEPAKSVELAVVGGQSEADVLG